MRGALGHPAPATTGAHCPSLAGKGDETIQPEQVTVHFPWHPLHGQTMLIRRSVRDGRELWLCEPDQHTAAIPVWMTDRVACPTLSIGPVLVSVEALTELASLVNATRSAHDPVIDLLQEEHHAMLTAETIAHAVRSRRAGRRSAGADQELVKAVADLLLATVLDADHDEEQHDACEDRP
jgi:hypothetical protein